ncbi:O-antigen translocase [Pectobacterium parmentieri]|uniref:O-antigen flippase n=1 Tax=Pectobacterium parmentieri TaxID=1905730 RepID=A0A8B3FG10_PECPM|nr:O-antigen translocase [Pectobacterium parmentieri]AYH15265.1 O-antigen flippase [Pectobacterium parmentieri]MBI0549341.1 O-antigen translocase [Pectobacterium parmentieri]MBI0558361.1 O-antigen translocase [Pectobacterium parmentieri]MBI0562414.1 O-antigen translocase [Pectobacterium parmentieri]PWD64752.1 O-antigen translocase [Pectobacterium parmentieri]
MGKLNITKVTIFSGVVTFFRLSVGLAISKIVAIYTGPEGVSMLGQFQNFINLINGFVSSQVSQGVNRYTAENGEDFEATKFFWRAALKLSAIATGLIMIIGILLSNKISLWLFSNESYYWLIIASLFLVPLNVANGVFLGVINGLFDYNRYFISNLLSIFSSLLTVCILVYLWGLEGALIAVAINNAIAGTWLIFILWRQKWFSLYYWLGNTKKEHFREMMNYFFMGVIGAFTGPVSLILVRSTITSHLSLTDSGYWQAVIRVSDAYLAILMTVMTVYYFPKTASAKNKSEHLNILYTGLKSILPLAVIMAFCVYFLRDLILEMLFTSDFSKASHLFFFQNIGDVIRISSWLFATILLAKGYFKINALLEIIFSFTFPAFTFYFIDSLGLRAASIAYCLNYILYFIVVCIIYFLHIKRLRE